MDVKRTVAQILERVGTAMHAKGYAEKIIATGHWQSKGKTPDATVTEEELAIIMGKAP